MGDKVGRMLEDHCAASEARLTAKFGRTLDEHYTASMERQERLMKIGEGLLGEIAMKDWLEDIQADRDKQAERMVTLETDHLDLRNKVLAQRKQLDVMSASLLEVFTNVELLSERRFGPLSVKIASLNEAP